MASDATRDDPYAAIIDLVDRLDNDPVFQWTEEDRAILEHAVGLRIAELTNELTGE